MPRRQGRCLAKGVALATETQDPLCNWSIRSAFNRHIHQSHAFEIRSSRFSTSPGAVLGASISAKGEAGPQSNLWMSDTPVAMTASVPSLPGSRSTTSSAPNPGSARISLECVVNKTWGPADPRTRLNVAGSWRTMAVCRESSGSSSSTVLPFFLPPPSSSGP